MLDRALTADDILITFLDDTKEAPWMVMGYSQGWSVNHFASTLQTHAHLHRLGWYVATLLPIVFRRPDGRMGKAAPDVFVAFVPEYPRQSYDLEVEGSFPPFVLEVVSRESRRRDLEEKRALYERLGGHEYALFAPLETDSATGEAGTTLLEPPLQGYRRDEAGRFAPWEPDAQGRLWSQVLDLYLAVKGTELGLQYPDGRWLLGHEEEAAARQREALAWQQEAAARRQAEAEIARLRAELERRRED